jgi:D-alanyl-D-alanine carboxypeptidase
LPNYYFFMPDHFEKFLFLGVVVALALFSRVADPELYQPPSDAGSSRGSATVAAEVPLFVMGASGTSTTVSRTSTDGEPAMLGGGTAAAQNAPAESAAPSEAATNAAVASPFAKIGDASAPAITDEGSLIADLETGNAYLSINANQRWPLASVTKLMTASLVMDDMSLDQNVTIAPEAIAADPSQQLLTAGETFTVSDLLHILLLPSSNVAAEALADYYGRTRFIDQMNARAASWGMTSTHYDDPSGLSASDESTPDDLLKLAQEIYANYPQILAITRTPQVTVTDQSSGKTMSVRSINDFAGRGDFIGGKTGYTDEADGNLLSIFRYENRPVLIIVMGADDDQRFDNTLMLYNWFVENYK